TPLKTMHLWTFMHEKGRRAFHNERDLCLSQNLDHKCQKPPKTGHRFLNFFGCDIKVFELLRVDKTIANFNGHFEISPSDVIKVHGISWPIALDSVHNKSNCCREGQKAGKRIDASAFIYRVRLFYHRCVLEGG